MNVIPPKTGSSTRIIAPLNRVSIRDDVYALLRNGILSHSYPPGHRLDLDDLSNQLQVSRTPVKEALHKLETEGLVQILPRRGTFVASLDAKSISESYDVRLALERFAAPTVLKNAGEPDLANLRKIKGQMRAMLHAPDFAVAIEQYIMLDQAFHVQIVTLSGNDRLIEIYRTIGGPLQMARILNKFDANDYLNYTEPEHEAIVQAMENRDGAALQLAMTEHVERAKARILNRIDRSHLNGKES